MSTVQDIVTLQAFDNEAAAFRAALADVEQQLQGDPELDEARRTAQELDATVANLRKEQRRIDAEIAGLTAKIDPEEQRLYDGSVKNPKELSNIQTELDMLKKHRTEFEEELLGVMSSIDANERAAEAARTAVTSLEQRWEGRTAELKREAIKLQDAIGIADQKRLRQKELIPPRPLSTYEDLRRRKGGLAVAKLQGGVCQGCRIMVPEGIRRRVFSPALLAQCPSCDRILAVG
jgi:predicted  nucleic acid-binding Zn-ribbon protein